MSDLSEKYKKVRARTEHICKPLKTEDYIPQPEAFVSPPKWHLAHTTWFFETMVLKQFKPDYKVFRPKFNYLFNSYYESIGTRVLRNKRGDLSRPTVAEVYDYRSFVDKAMQEFFSGKINDKAAGIIMLGLQHEQQHQELLLTDIKYILAANPLFPAYAEKAPEETLNKGKEKFIKIPEGLYEIGFDGEGFCFDNELERHKVYLQDYEISNHLVTNADFIDFIKDGGYEKHRLWHADAWQWIQQENITMPLYWAKKKEDYFYFTLSGFKPVMPEAQLAHISYFEAYAFARWKGCRLPTEFEWEVAQQHFQWGNRWEWTESAYLPYPGYKQAESVIGEYNGKFMVSQKVLRGSSLATPENHARPSYRNFFYPPERWQFTGIRLAK